MALKNMKAENNSNTDATRHNEDHSSQFEEIPLADVSSTNSLASLDDKDKKKSRWPFIATKKSDKWLYIQAGFLVLIVAVVWILLTLPIVFFYLPASELTPNATNINQSTMCQSVVPYEGTICKSELQSLRNCISSSSQSSSILIESDQSETVRPLLEALIAFASDECRAAALPFLCVHFFGLCDSTGRAYRPSSSQCTEISTGVCATEWALASSFPDVTLPDCKSFPNETVLTESCESSSGNGAEIDLDQLENSTNLTCQPSENNCIEQSLNCTITCSKGFHCQEEDSGPVCIPTCGKFAENSATTTSVIDVLLVLCAILGISCAIAVLIISCIRWKQMFAFPTSIVVYEVITYLVLVTVTLITFTDREALYCSSQDLLESIANPTAYCTLSGIVFYYTLFQLAVWWILHVTAVFWKLKFPFHAHAFKKTKYLHIICVVLALLLPLVPVITTTTTARIHNTNTTSVGFGLTRFPPILCTGTDRHVTFYSLVLPLDLILFIGFPLLVMIFWIMRKNHINKSKTALKIGTAEKKILIVFCYYTAFAVFSLSAFAVAIRSTDTYFATITDYFVCERSGHDADNVCDRGRLEAMSEPAVSAISYFLVAIFPVASLIFVINFRETMAKVKSHICVNKAV